jgi:hypothetical protein
MFADVFNKTAFQSFFRLGREFDKSFAYQVTFGFMPRQFEDNSQDRYILEEEGDVTEIYFIMQGKWAVAFDSFAKTDEINDRYGDQDETYGPKDMNRRGILIALKKLNYGYVGDYYVLASKRS